MYKNYKSHPTFLKYYNLQDTESIGKFQSASSCNFSHIYYNIISKRHLPLLRVEFAPFLLGHNDDEHLPFI